MRRWLGVMTLACLAVPWAVSVPAGAQDPSLSNPFEPLQRLGRAMGVGWGDGYHACSRDSRSPVADLPPRSYAAQHSLHRHPNQSGHQHWQAAAQTHPMYGWQAHPRAFPSPEAGRQYGHSGSPNRPQFPVPPSVLEELENLPRDVDRKVPSDVAPQQERPSTASSPNALPPLATRAPGTNNRSVNPSLRAAPSPPVNQLDSMLQELKDDEQGNADTRANVSDPLQSSQDALGGSTLEEEFSTSDLLLENPSQTADLLEADLLDSLPREPFPPRDRSQTIDPLLEGLPPPTAEEPGDLLLDDQAARRHHIREPVAGMPRRISASERLARQRAAANR